MDTLALQQILNPLMIANGYVPLTTDGKLGKKTCGAAKQLMPDAVPTECASIGYTPPGKPAKVASPLFATAPVSTPPMTSSMMSSTKWIIGGSIAVALGLVGFAIAKKKGMI
jgi:hypothetical protein